MRGMGLFIPLVLVLFCVCTATADVVIICPSDDAYVDSNSPGDNYGSESSISLGTGSLADRIHRVYLRFDLSCLARTEKVASAKIRLACTYRRTADPNVGVYWLGDEAWDESTITWNNAPVGFNPTAADTSMVGWGDNFWTVTKYTRNAHEQEIVFSMVAKFTDETKRGELLFSSKESADVNSRPYLEVKTQDPLLISTAAELNDIGKDPNLWDEYFALTNDINLSEHVGTEFNIIGYWEDWDSPNNVPFTGVFDGNGHTILNFSYMSCAEDGIGLFAYVGDPNAEIRDLTLTEPNVEASDCNMVGSLVGYLEQGVVSRCDIVGGKVTGDIYVGGLVGYSRARVTSSSSSGTVNGGDCTGGLAGYNYLVGTISDSYSRASVLGGSKTGGLVGYSALPPMLFPGRPEINNCYAAGSVCGVSDVGGLTGVNSGLMSNSYATGPVEADQLAGGLVGRNYGDVLNCYSTGSVSGGTNAGGLVGTGGGAWNCFWDIQTSGQTTSAGGTGKTTAQMQTASTFVGWSACGSEGVWTIDGGNAPPRLFWENSPGQPLEQQALSDFLPGAGTANEPYLIDTAEALNTVGAFPCEFNKHFKLVAEVSLAEYTGTEFNIIGGERTRFTGVFDGNGHTISSFSYTVSDGYEVGLFPCLGGHAEVRNLGLVSPNINATGEGRKVGSLVGSLVGATVSDCWVEGGTVTGEWCVGGLVGWIEDAAVTGSQAAAMVIGTSNVGGLMGWNGHRGTISRCHSAGDVSGVHSVGGLVGRTWLGGPIARSSSSANVDGVNGVGGLVGWNYSTITECSATGSVTGDSLVGGLVGRGSCDFCWIWDSYARGNVRAWSSGAGGLAGSNEGRVYHCYAAGTVQADDDVGGLIGYQYGTCLGKSFWNITLNPDLRGIGNVTDANAVGKTTAQMQTKGTYADASWDFVNAWDICEGTNYPRFLWQIPTWDFLCPDGVDGLDYSFFAGHWGAEDCGISNDCDGTDLDLSGAVDWGDVRIFCDHWLEGVVQ